MSKANQDAIARWGAMPRAVVESYDEEGDFSKRHLLNAQLRRLLGDVNGRRVLDAGCGEGYFSRLLAQAGATVVGVEPGRALIDRAIEVETERRQGITYVEADLCELPDLGGAFDAVVCSMVLPAIPDWQPALRNGVDALRPGGTLVFSANHPCFEGLWRNWRQNGAYRISRYLQHYEIILEHGTDYHRPISAYLNEVAALGCRIIEVAEPGLDPVLAAESGIDGIEAYVHLPNFVVVSAERLG